MRMRFLFAVFGLLLVTNWAGSSPAVVLPPTLEVPSEWLQAAEGIEVRRMRVSEAYTLVPFDMLIARINPDQVIWRVHYEPRQTYRIRQWRERLNDPVLIVNANFFTEHGEAVGLVISDGRVFGRSFEGYGGMVEVGKNAVRLRSLPHEPYRGEPLNQAAQGFPVLVAPDGVAARTGQGFDDPASRTIAAQDSSGRILLMTTTYGQLTLRNAQKWLLESGLEIEIAFGLDGGKSSGMLVETPRGTIFYNSIEAVPVVIALYAR